MSNFDFILKNELFKPFAEASVEAENSLAVTNVSCAIMCRRALENDRTCCKMAICKLYRIN